MSWPWGGVCLLQLGKVDGGDVGKFETLSLWDKTDSKSKVSSPMMKPLVEFMLLIKSCTYPQWNLTAMLTLVEP